VLLGVLVVAIILVAAGGAYVLTHARPPAGGAAATQTNTPVAVRAITDTTANVRFNIPQGWTTTGSVAAGNGFEAESLDHNSVIVVAALSLPSGATFDPVAGAKGALAGAANYGPVTYEQGPTNVSLAGATWTQVTGSYTREGTHLREVVLVMVRGGKMYLLSLISTVDTFDTANTRYFQPLEQSFTFLS
jgi:hypothetical protein